MGPQTIFDKSFIQSLNFDESTFLWKHYYVVIPPVLIIEILADLKDRIDGLNVNGKFLPWWTNCRKETP